MGRIEVITGKERRRPRSLEEKEQLLRQAFQPGSNVDAFARQNDIATSSLYTWRKQLWGEKRATSFAPVIQVPDVPAINALSVSQGMQCTGLSNHTTTRDEIVIELKGKKAWIPSSMPAELAAAVVAALVKS